AAGRAGEMERVADDDLGAVLLELGRHHAVDGAVRAHRHEGRRVDVAAARAQDAGARHAAFMTRLDVDAQSFRHARPQPWFTLVRRRARRCSPFVDDVEVSYRGRGGSAMRGPRPTGLRNIATGGIMRPRTAHFIGIAGAGMSAAAKLLKDSGVKVTGS